MADTPRPTPEPDPFQDFTLRLRSVPSTVPAVVRARRLLKLALRSCGFRAEFLTTPPDRRAGHDADAGTGGQAEGR